MINLFIWNIIVLAIVVGLSCFLIKRKIILHKAIVLLFAICIGIICLIPIMVDFIKQDFPVSYGEEYVINSSIIDVNELENVGEILEGNSVEQYFICNKKTIAYISLYMYTYERNNLGSINVELIDETEGQTIDKWHVDTIDIECNAYLKLDVENPFFYDLYGHECLIKITSDTVDPYSAVTVKKQNTEYDTIRLVVGGENQDGNMIFAVVGYGESTSKEWTRIALSIIVLLITEFIFFDIYRRKYVY
ncbi:hypothetical protein SAMN05216351_10735 [Pseudobutyrivibrio sp. JW11]|uniref:hypothetical protein n=1 Tax=Pseudobutyrivibrio sp. JW11 TaxID=1855302 RepID=UPI0008E64001|nr:hypothetical protein [Pseudobutyrivibrio sp. JW11]SFO35065.1 hypothetical protein SAMN05216351_10735 [Pseudobutyrivibrio sp. JW11]